MRRRIFESVSIITEAQVLSHEEHETLQRALQRNFEHYRELVEDLRDFEWKHVQVFTMPGEHYQVVALCGQMDDGAYFDPDSDTWVRKQPWEGQWLHKAMWQVWVTAANSLSGPTRVIDDVVMSMLVGDVFRGGMREEVAQEILQRLRQRGWDLVPLNGSTVSA